MVSVKPVCKIEGCDRNVKAHGYCKKHYDRWLTVRPDGKLCSEERCLGVAFVKGLCQQHYSKAAYDKRKVKFCALPNCFGALWAKGMCQKHWSDSRRDNDQSMRQVRVKEVQIDMEQIKDVLTSGEVAKITNVAPRTVAKWIDSGMLTGYRLPGSKDRRVEKTNLLRFMQEHKMSVHLSSKRNVILYGVQEDQADIIKSLTENELGVNIHVTKDSFSAGVLVGETKPNAILVDSDDLSSILPMLRAMDLSSAEVIIATSDDPSKLHGLSVNFLPKPYRVKDAMGIIAKHI